jgi:hypothetical protein
MVKVAHLDNPQNGQISPLNFVAFADAEPGPDVYANRVIGKDISPVLR